MGGKAPAVKNSRSHVDQTIYRAQLGQKLPWNYNKWWFELSEVFSVKILAVLKKDKKKETIAL